MPPVPKVALAAPGVVQPWPTSDACWSPAIPQIGGEPASTDAAPTAPDESTMAGSIDNGMRSRSSTASSQWRMSGWTRPVTPALVASVTCRPAPPAPPPDSVQATQVSMVPKHSWSARARSGSTSSRMAASLVADMFGASRMPSACRVRQVPTVRRSCQPMAGATGSPVRRSHTTVVQRWLAMPTPATGPPSARAAAARSSTASAMRRGSISTRPGAGVSGRTGRWWTWSTVASGRTTAARTPEVPTSTTRRLPPAADRPRLTATGPRRRWWRDRACPD